MATTAIWDVKSSLSRVVDYAKDPEKSGEPIDLDAALDYAMKPEKTEHQLYVTGINCIPETASEEMKLTKQAWNKDGGIIAFHGYQSFKPGETTPAQAHEVGVEFARRMWGERFQVVVSTHLDKAHLHNHFVVNSVSFLDGKRYYDNKKSYYGQMRPISDQLCREYGLSVLEETQGKGKDYTERMAEKAGKPTLKSMLRADVDEIIWRSFTYQSFLEELRRRGYTVLDNPNHKYLAVIPQGTAKHFRLPYTVEEIKAHLARQRDGEAVEPLQTTSGAPWPPKRYKIIHKPVSRHPRRKLTGFLALSFH